MRSTANADQEQRLLFDKASFKYTPLIWAVRGGSADAVRALVGGGADVNRPVGHRPPLVWALQEGSDSVIAALLSQPAVDIHVVNSLGQNVLYWAITSRRDSAACELIRRGADFREADSHGVTGIELACGAVGTRGSEAALDAMLDCGLAGDELVGTRFKDRKTVLMFVCQHGSLDCVRKALRSSRDVEARDASGRSAEDYAREREDGKSDATLKLLRDRSDG